MNSPKLKAVLKKVVEDLQAMSPEEITQLEQSLPEGPFFHALLDSGFISAHELIAPNEEMKPQRVSVAPILQGRQPGVSAPLRYSSSPMAKTGFRHEPITLNEDIEWAA